MTTGLPSSTNPTCATRPEARISAARSVTARSGWRWMDAAFGVISELYWEIGSAKRANLRKSMVPFISLRLDRASPMPLQRQLYSEIREAVLGRRLAAGVRLPSTRTLAADLGVSRNTVSGAFEQLLAEGYI